MALDLRAEFENVRAAYPRLLPASATPLGGGLCGLVADNNDARPAHPFGTVTKVLFRSDDAALQNWVNTLFRNEVGYLRAMDGRPLGAFAVPALDAEPVLLDGERHFAAYTMTRLPGMSGTWHAKHSSGFDYKSFFREAGRALARFHTVEPIAGRSERGIDRLIKADRIGVAPGLDPDTCRGLTLGDIYLQSHCRPANLHGDYYDGNISANGASPLKVNGLMDFAMSGWGRNHLADFTILPACGRTAAVEGYEEESGSQIDRAALDMTMIASNVHLLNTRPQDENSRQELVEDILYRLDRSGPAIGYKPQVC